MKVQRNISSGRIFIALIITVLIFCLGISLGLLLDSQRIQWSETQAKEQRADYESLRWQYLFLTSAENKEETCISLKVALDTSVNDLGASLDKIQNYRKQTQLNDKEYTIIERTYVIDNLKYWLLAKKTKEECGADYSIILYFFSDKSCSICPDQGTILTYYKQKYEEKLLVFPINLDLESQESSLKIVKDVYNITSFPTLIIENVKYEGLVDTNTLGQILFDDFEKNEETNNITFD